MILYSNCIFIFIQRSRYVSSRQSFNYNCALRNKEAELNWNGLFALEREGLFLSVSNVGAEWVFIHKTGRLIFIWRDLQHTGCFFFYSYCIQLGFCHCHHICTITGIRTCLFLFQSIKLYSQKVLFSHDLHIIESVCFIIHGPSLSRHTPSHSSSVRFPLLRRWCFSILHQI